MGLMDKAVEAATDADARQRAAQANNIRRQGNDRAETLSKAFGLDFEFADRYPDETHYLHKYREYGGPVWVQDKHRYIWLFKVDDILVGTIETSGSSKTSESFALPKNCPSCHQQRYFPIGYVSTYGDDTEKHQADLIVKIGKVATSDEPCTVCQAQPCPNCGRSY